MNAKMFQHKKVIDARHALNLHVKPDDIKTAKRKDPRSCAIARCVIRDKHVISARIGQKIALIEYASHFERYKINRTAREAVREFDRDGSFVAGEYQLMPICKSERLTGESHMACKKSGPSGPSGESHKRKRATRNIFKAKECITP